ncbi:MAG TPA: HAMP domain-containing sensor histidine kinase [Vicinamibacterales bacterium]|nr:HAMP domain-containing sensor histidine kinase [Vicinamibacterales bacterium]
MTISNFGDFIAARMRKEHQALAARWFDRLLDILPVQAREIFPTQSLLDHVPALILEISDYLREPEGEAIASNTAILEKAAELGALRYTQRASLHQVLREYQVLGGVLTRFVFEELECAGASPTPADTAQLVVRLQRAVDVLAQATVEEFVGLYTKTIGDQAERLDQFNRMAAHEWRQPLAALQWGVRALRETALDRPTMERTLAAVERSVEHLIELTHKLETIARVRSDGDNPVVQTVSISTVGHEAARQLREMAEARGVDIRIADQQPVLTVDVGRLELAFVNLLSNAIKYSDPAKPERYVEIATEGDGEWVRIDVRDNGVGIPRAALATVFGRFTRAHAGDGAMGHVAGIGLGLAIVEDCVRSMRGRIDVQSEEKQGTTFTLRLPAHGS